MGISLKGALSYLNPFQTVPDKKEEFDVVINGDASTERTKTVTDRQPPVMNEANNVHVELDPNSEEFKDKLSFFEKLIDTAVSSDTSYSDYRDHLDVLSDSLKEEDLYKKCFKLLSKENVSKEQLVANAQAVMDVLTKNQTEFDTKIKSQIDHEVKQTNSDLETKRLTIKKYKEQIEILTNEVTALESTISEKQSKYKRGYDVYNSISNDIQSQVASDIEKINKYI